VVLIIALLKIAIPLSLISCYATPFELRHALSLTQVTRVFVAPQYLSRVLPIAAELGIPSHKVYLMNEEDISGQASVESLIRGAKEKQIPEEQVRIVPKDTLGYLVTSSGTTGLPKGLPINSHSPESGNLILMDSASCHGISRKYHLFFESGNRNHQRAIQARSCKPSKTIH